VVGSVAGSVLVGGAETLLNYEFDPSLASALVLALAVVLVRLRPRGIVPGYSAARELLGQG
jgi:branched-chain amino acid transport system permease protein